MAADYDLVPLGRSLVEELRPTFLLRGILDKIPKQLRQPVVDTLRRGNIDPSNSIFGQNHLTFPVEDFETNVPFAIRIGLANGDFPRERVGEDDHVVAESSRLLRQQLACRRRVANTRHVYE